MQYARRTRMSWYIQLDFATSCTPACFSDICDPQSNCTAEYMSHRPTSRCEHKRGVRSDSQNILWKFALRAIYQHHVHSSRCWWWWWSSTSRSYAHCTHTTSSIYCLNIKWLEVALYCEKLIATSCFFFTDQLHVNSFLWYMNFTNINYNFPVVETKICGYSHVWTDSLPVHTNVRSLKHAAAHYRT